MLFITPELTYQQDAYHQKMLNTPRLRHYWPYLLKYPLFDNTFLFILFIFPFFAVLSYKYLLFLLPFPSMVLFSYLTALLAHTTNGYALPPRGDRLIGGFIVQVALLIGKRSSKPSWPPLSHKITASYIRTRVSINTEDKVKKIGQQQVNPIAVKQILFVIFSIGLLALSSYYVNNIALALIALLWLSLLPISLVQIAIDDCILSGLNIKKMQRFIRKMDNQYGWVMIATLISTGLFYITIFQFSGILFIISLFICLYSLIVCFHLLGYLLYHRRHTIGFLAENSPEVHAEAQADKLYLQADGIVQQAKIQITDKGLFKHGLEILKLHLSRANNDLALHGEVSKLLFEWQDKRLALRHAKLYLHLLIQQQKYVTTYQILQKSRAQQDDFTLEEVTDYLPFIEYLLHTKQNFSLSLYLIECFEQQYPNHEHYFAIQLVKAKLLSEHSQHLEQARFILGRLIKQNQHPQHKEALKLAHHLSKL